MQCNISVNYVSSTAKQALEKFVYTFPLLKNLGYNADCSEECIFTCRVE
jgi:hypothetical protein